MATVIALIFLIVCVFNIVRFFAAPSALNAFAAVLGIFSIGYFQLPIFFIDQTPMRNLQPEIVATVAWMALLFHLCVLTGVEIVRSRVSSIRPLTLPAFDEVLRRNWWAVTVVSAAIHIFYITTIATTSYSADDFGAYFEERTPFAGAISFFAQFALGILAVNLAIAVRDRHASKIAVSLALLGLIEVILLGKGQRLVFITPLFMVLAALIAQRQYRNAALGSLVGVVALVLVSPFAVMLREARTTDRTLTASNIDYDLGDSPASALLQSLLDRADGLEVATVLKDHFDRRGSGMNVRYFYSVIVAPVPRIFFSQKPYQLSPTGEADGEVSVLAWQLRNGTSYGSLTAFGFIVAYREGGWPMVIGNGIASGLLFGFLLLTLARGGYVAQALFTISFLNWSVRKVPPSFWEAIADIMNYLPLVVILLIANALLARRATPTAVSALSAG